MSASSPISFLTTREAMADWVQEFDWAASGFGPMHAWPPHLQTAVAMVFDSPQPMRLTWGPRRLMVYNHGYADILAHRHPAAFGRPMQQTWPDLWPIVGPSLDRVFAGESLYMQDVAYVIERNGQPLQIHVTFTYLPVRGPGGAIDGARACASKPPLRCMPRASNRPAMNA